MHQLEADTLPPSSQAALYQPTLWIVDDDRAVCHALGASFEDLGFVVHTHPTAEDFLERRDPFTPGCLLLDLVLRGMSGLTLLEQLPEDDPLHVVVLTGFADVPSAVHALKGGAVDFIEKPPPHQDLVDAVAAAAERSRREADRQRHVRTLRRRIATLTPAERTVLDGLLAGKTTARIAAELSRSERTVGNHRQHILNKMNAGNTVELVRMALAAGWDPIHPAAAAG